MDDKTFEKFIRTQNMTTCAVEVLFEMIPKLEERVTERLKKHYAHAYKVYKQKQGEGNAKASNFH